MYVCLCEFMSVHVPVCAYICKECICACVLLITFSFLTHTHTHTHTHIYSAKLLFSALEQIHCTLVTCDSNFYMSD